MTRRGRVLAAITAGSAVVLVVVVTAGSRQLGAREQRWLVLGCTLLAVAVGTLLFWITDRETGWVIPTAALLAVTPIAVGDAASGMALASSGRQDSCVVTGVDIDPALDEGLRTARHREQLDCAASGPQEIEWARPGRTVGERLDVWVDDGTRRSAVVTDAGGRPDSTGALVLALLVLVGLALSGAAAARQAGRPISLSAYR